LYVRVSTSDRGQSVENQLTPLQDAAGRLGWSIVGVFRDEGISGTRGRDKRTGLDALLKGVARRDFDIVAAWNVCRLGRSLPDLIGLLGELRFRTSRRSTLRRHPVGRCSECWMYSANSSEGDGCADRVRSSGKRLGRPRTTPFTVQRILAALDEGRGVRETARLLKVSAKVNEVRRLSPSATAVNS
jgi:hypothetical protein